MKDQIQLENSRYQIYMKLSIKKKKKWENKFFLSTREILTKIHCRLGHLGNFNKFHRLTIILTIFSGHNVIKLELIIKGRIF